MSWLWGQNLWHGRNGLVSPWKNQQVQSISPTTEKSNISELSQQKDRDYCDFFPWMFPINKQEMENIWETYRKKNTYQKHSQNSVAPIGPTHPFTKAVLGRQPAGPPAAPSTCGENSWTPKLRGLAPGGPWGSLGVPGMWPMGFSYRIPNGAAKNKNGDMDPIYKWYPSHFFAYLPKLYMVTWIPYNHYIRQEMFLHFSTSTMDWDVSYGVIALRGI